MLPLHRRDFLRAAAAFAGAAPLALAADKPLKVAALFTEFRYRSHAHVILENFLEPLLLNGQWVEPNLKVVSFFADQAPDKDLAPEVAKLYKAAQFKTIAEALCLGGDELAVDAVLSIGEHGDYPVNDKGVREYPRKRFFDEIAKVMKASKRAVPVFNDKHLSWRWDWAKEMWDTAAALKMPLMAGSSVPLATRKPALDLPKEPRFSEAVAIHGGPFEVYDFHGLEVLQSFVESRKGGETGVKQVQFLEGDALWKAAEDSAWSPKVAEAAMAAELGEGTSLKKVLESDEFKKVAPWGTLVNYKDGLRGLVLKLGEKHTRWNFACRLGSDVRPRACSFYPGPWGNRNLFMALSHAIQAHFRDKKPPYPAERTLLTTGILAAAVESRHAKGKAVATPHLDIAYTSPDWSEFRERGESWNVLTEDTAQPAGIKKQFK